MLDAFIIDRIRRERGSRDSLQTPLHIEIPQRPPLPDEQRSDREEDEKVERGVVIIDFSI